MADDHLDKYLEDIGIDVEGDDVTPIPEEG